MTTRPCASHATFLTLLLRLERHATSCNAAAHFLPPLTCWAAPPAAAPGATAPPAGSPPGPPSSSCGANRGLVCLVRHAAACKQARFLGRTQTAGQSTAASAEHARSCGGSKLWRHQATASPRVPGLTRLINQLPGSVSLLSAPSKPTRGAHPCSAPGRPAAAAPAHPGRSPPSGKPPHPAHPPPMVLPHHPPPAALLRSSVSRSQTGMRDGRAGWRLAV